MEGHSPRPIRFTPISCVRQDGNRMPGTFGKPTGAGKRLSGRRSRNRHRLENRVQGGRLFATDPTRASAPPVTTTASRIVIVDLKAKHGHPVHHRSALPVTIPPSARVQGRLDLLVAGSTTNSGVVGLDNGGGANQQDIPCQDIVLSNNTFPSPGGVRTSGYSPHGVQRPGATVKAFRQRHEPGCATGRFSERSSTPRTAEHDRAFLVGLSQPVRRSGSRPRITPSMAGCSSARTARTKRGARPTNNSPDRLQLAQQNPDGSPDYHGWPTGSASWPPPRRCSIRWRAGR